MGIKNKSSRKTENDQQQITYPTLPSETSNQSPWLIYPVLLHNTEGSEQTEDESSGHEGSVEAQGINKGNKKNKIKAPTPEMIEARRHVLEQGKAGNHLNVLRLKMGDYAHLKGKEREARIKKARMDILRLVYPDRWPDNEERKSNAAAKCK